MKDLAHRHRQLASWSHFDGTARPYPQDVPPKRSTCPAKDGFVFSTVRIHAAIDPEHRLERAAADFTGYKLRKFQTQAA